MRSEDSIYAIEGTKAHDLAERALAAGARACTVDDSNGEMAAAVQVYLDEIAFVRATSTVLCEHTERKLDCLTIAGLGGTADHMMLYREDDKIVLHLFDYKHGVGVPVAAEENMQLLSYFVIHESQYQDMVDEFRCTIVQPRAFAGDGVQTWACSLTRVQEHAERIVTETAKDHLAAGDWCRWCPALMICPEVQRHAAEIAAAEFSEVDIETLLHYEQIGPAITAFLKKIPQTLIDTFRFGDGIPGKKVIERLSNRKWKLAVSRVRPELEKLGLAKEAIVEEKLRTPPQIEKLLDKEGRKALEPFVTRDVVGYKIVPESAKGTPVDFNVSEFTEFTDVSED